MLRVNTEVIFRKVMGIGCFLAAGWLTLRTIHWIHITWFGNNALEQSLMIPIMSGLDEPQVFTACEN